ncbi:MATE family efflux transporter [Ideonella azotifigens]|nr:MATE family efflux transporter [Ideonella azotifigens]MCD2339349.1 MATE family efflux transporter [Ideonella azotifigens]
MPHPPRLLKLVWPLFLELGLGMAVSLIGTALAARLSDEAGAGFALANHVFATLFMLFRVIGAGISVVLTQCLGSQRRDQADAVARAALGAATWIGAAAAVMALVGARGMLGLVNAPAEVLVVAVPFLMTLAPCILLDAWNASMASVMRSHLHAREALFVIITMHLVHLLLAVPLMRGWGPVPALGLPGYALAMLGARFLGVALHLLLWKVRLGLVPTRRDWWHPPRRQLAAILRIGLPGAAENLSWRLCFMASVAAAGHMGAQALATHAYVMQVMYWLLLFGAATGLAVEIVVGHLIGAGQLHEAHQLVRKALGRGIVVSLCLALLAALAGRHLLGLFTEDAEILRNGALLLWLTVLVEPGRTFNLVVINALRAAGDARYPVIAGTGSLLLVLAGGSWLLGVHLGLGLPGLWLAYACDEWIRGLLMWRRWAKQAWVPHARATHRALRRDRHDGDVNLAAA